MRSRFIILPVSILSIFLSFASACASASARREASVTNLFASQDTSVSRLLQERLLSVHQALDDTTTLAELRRLLDDTATLAALHRTIEAQQVLLQRILQDDQVQRMLFEQLERNQRALDEILRRKPR